MQKNWVPNSLVSLMGNGTPFIRRFRKIAKVDYYLRHVCPSVWNNSSSIVSIIMKFYIALFFENTSRKFKFRQNLTRITSTLHEGLHTIIISRPSLLIMSNVSEKSSRENQNTHTFFNSFFEKSCHLWDIKNMYTQLGHRLRSNTAHGLCALVN